MTGPPPATGDRTVHPIRVFALVAAERRQGCHHQRGRPRSVVADAALSTRDAKHAKYGGRGAEGMREIIIKRRGERTRPWGVPRPCFPTHEGCSSAFHPVLKGPNRKVRRRAPSDLIKDFSEGKGAPVRGSSPLTGGGRSLLLSFAPFCIPPRLAASGKCRYCRHL